MNCSNRFWSKTEPELNTGCLLWAATPNKQGYGQFSVGRRFVFAHRMAWALANGAIPAGLFVLHKCDTPACVNPAHLFLGTHRDNMRDCVAKGRTRNQDGAAAPRAKLTEEQAREGLRRCRAGESQSAVAADLGVTPSSINHMVAGRSWPHLHSRERS